MHIYIYIHIYVYITVRNLLYVRDVRVRNLQIYMIYINLYIFETINYNLL